MQAQKEEDRQTELCLSLENKLSMASTTAAVFSSSLSRAATNGINDCTTGSISPEVRSLILRFCPTILSRGST